VEHQAQADQFLENFIGGAKELGFSFQENILKQFCLYYEVLSLWNRSVNLTGLKTEQEQAVLLFADSLAGSFAFPENQSVSMVDIGTGAGFPGIPLKLAFPSLGVTLMEPRGNKVAFLHTAIGKLGLTGISVLQKRLEECRSILEEDKWDVAVSKAVSLGQILPHVRNILKEDGRLVVFRSTNLENSEKLPGMAIEKEIHYELPFGFGVRVLSVLKLAR